MLALAEKKMLLDNTRSKGTSLTAGKSQRQLAEAREREQVPSKKGDNVGLDRERRLGERAKKVLFHQAKRVRIPEATQGGRRKWGTSEKEELS